MSHEELALPVRWAASLTALLDAGGRCEQVAGALLGLLPGATAAQCQLDGDSSSAGRGAADRFLTADVETAGVPRGRVGVALAAPVEGAQQILALAARLVALSLPPAADELRQTLDLVTVGEAAGWVVHALNNHLNGMVLQAACVQMQTQSPLREQAEHIRREGARAAARLRPLQAVRPWPAREGEQVDLVRSVRDALREEGSGRIEAQLQGGEAVISASRMGVRRMLVLLFRVVLRSVGPAQKVRLALTRQGPVELSLALPGLRAQGEEEGLEGLPPEAENGVPQVEREALRWLIRQNNGRLETEQGDDGLRVTIRWGS
jgi:hypothetical protein